MGAARVIYVTCYSAEKESVERMYTMCSFTPLKDCICALRKKKKKEREKKRE